MSSEKQIEANHQNGFASKGPASEEGKAISSKNSLGHGLTAKEALLPTEDAEAYVVFCKELKAELNPAGALESILVERIVGLAWRLRRFGRIEAGILAWQYHNQRAHQAIFPVFRCDTRGRKREQLREDERGLFDHGEHLAAQTSDLAMVGDAFSRDIDSFSKLARYEGSMTRNLFRTLHELERRQTARQGKYVPPPLAVDVTGLDESAEALD